MEIIITVLAMLIVVWLLVGDVKRQEKEKRDID